MSYLKVSNIKKTISNNNILKGISFELEKGKVLVILGKSGAGKTTLLRNLNFLDFPDEGSIELDGKILYNSNSKPLSNIELQETHKLLGLVFQNFNLFPHLTVMDNITLAPVKLKKGILKKMSESKVLNDGKIVEEGKYQELLDKNGCFKKLYKSLKICLVGPKTSNLDSLYLTIKKAFFNYFVCKKESFLWRI